ncbi:sec-independent protein translocase protein TatA [Motilibacter rhizosphaerae]|uniref:Sec-independent protein translocase protein TatA n=1 Tax=Motilibacter rhizosphaerae TaxID=598652 RepID=A0A4Q7NAZ5_9ACTN|nr:Sec-independent protein translocase subunit TatA [Motilibacter rhizosphaerae]RZS80086.1 sec-independent protein translocase protein TatA [Motilibacter rhizosphaerae]
MRNALEPWHLIILLLIVVILFGAKRLPDTARGLGRSLRIFKAETKGLIGDDKDEETSTATSTAAPVVAPRAIEPTVVAPAPQQAVKHDGVVER